MTLSQLQTMVLDRLGEDPSNPVFHTLGDVTRAINDAYATFAFLTLCVTKTANLTMTGQPYVALPTDWIVPFRVFSGASRVQPAPMTHLSALNSKWQQVTGAPKQYAVAGPSLIATSPVAANGSVLSVQYAAMPVGLANGSDVPVINAIYHEVLTDLAVPLRRLKEGGQELQQNLPDLQRFLTAVSQESGHVMSRAIAQRYDTLPREWKMGDWSKALSKLFMKVPVNDAALKDAS